MALALVLVNGVGAHVGAGLRRPPPTTPFVVTVDNPITGAGVPDAVSHRRSAPKAVVIGSGVTSSAIPERVPGFHLWKWCSRPDSDCVARPPRAVDSVVMAVDM